MYEYKISKNIADEGITKEQLNEWFDNVEVRMTNNGLDPSDYVTVLTVNENGLILLKPVKKVAE